MLWLLGPSSPIHGNAHVHLTDTRFFVLARLVHVLLGGQPVRGIAPAQAATAVPDRWRSPLNGSGEQSYGPTRWKEFLRLSANLFRINNRWLPKAPIETFYAAVDQHGSTPGSPDRCQAGDGPVAKDSANRGGNASAQHLQIQKLTPLMEPLIASATGRRPALGSRAHTLSVVHDEQSALTRERIVDIASAFAAELCRDTGLLRSGSLIPAVSPRCRSPISSPGSHAGSAVTSSRVAQIG